MSETSLIDEQTYNSGEMGATSYTVNKQDRSDPHHPQSLSYQCQAHFDLRDDPASV
jgi:hypothetical protein